MSFGGNYDTTGAVLWSVVLAVLLAASSVWAQGGPVAITMNPTTKNAVVGSTFDLTIAVNPATQPIDTVEAHLNFDPAIITILSVTNGTTLTSVIAPPPDNVNGRFDYAASLLGGVTVSTPFTLCTIHFRANAVGSTGVMFQHVLPRLTAAYLNGIDKTGSFGDATVIVVAPPASPATSTPGCQDLTPTPTPACQAIEATPTVPTATRTAASPTPTPTVPGCPYSFTTATGNLGATCGYTGTYTFQTGCPSLPVAFMGNGTLVDVVLGTQPAVTFSGTVQNADRATLTTVHIGTGPKEPVSAQASLSGPARNFLGISLFAGGVPFSLCPNPHGCTPEERCQFGFYSGSMIGEIDATHPLPPTNLQPVPEHP